MCGRFTLRTPPAEIAAIFELLREPELRPRYNISPTQNVAVVRKGETARELSMLKWGLIPSWAKDEKIGYRMINARADTLATKNSFRMAFKHRRCLILADGFYEWKKLDAKTKQPYHITLKKDEPFAFAGLWEFWKGEGEPIESCTIVTTEANTLLSELHDRMPVILLEEEYDRWLDPKNEDTAELQDLLIPYPAKEMQFTPVSKIVNSPRNETPDCLKVE